MGFELELRREDGATTTLSEDVIQSLQLPRRHSRIDAWQVTVSQDTDLEAWTYSDAYFYYENSGQGVPRQLVYRGEFERPETQDGASRTILHGKDVTRKLKRGHSIEKQYSSIPYHEAIRDYTSTELSDWNWTVRDPDVETIETGVVAQDTTSGDDMADVFSPPEDAPFEVNDDGELELLQTCFVREAENPDREQDPTFLTDAPECSGGNGRGISSSSSYLQWDFTPEYAIPAEHVDARVRFAGVDDEMLDWQLTLNGDVIAYHDSQGGMNSGPLWFDPETSFQGDGYTGSDLQAGETYTLALEATGSNGTNTTLDVVSVADDRFSYFYDDDNGGSGGYLDGPQLRPDAASVVSNAYSSTFNIPSADLTVVLDDSSGQQALQLSNDGGDTYLPSDGSEENTASVSADFSAQDSYGTTVRSKVTLSRYGARTDATPQTGFKGQTISEWTLEIATDDLSVIDQRTFTGSVFEIVQTLHRDGSLRFVTQHREDELAAETFRAGDIEKPLDVVVQDHTRTTPDAPYANSVTVIGGEDADGNRVTATAKNQTAINNDGGEIPAPPVERESLTSEGDLKSIARTQLSTHLQNDDLTGELEIWPKLVAPGYSYQVSELDDETLSLESVEFRYGGGRESGSLDFAGLNSVAATIAAVRAEASD